MSTHTHTRTHPTSLARTQHQLCFVLVGLAICSIAVQMPRVLHLTRIGYCLVSSIVYTQPNELDGWLVLHQHHQFMFIIRLHMLLAIHPFMIRYILCLYVFFCGNHQTKSIVGLVRHRLDWHSGIFLLACWRLRCSKISINTRGKAGWESGIPK